MVILMPVEDQSGSEFGPKIRGLGRKQDSLARVALQGVDVGQWMRTRAHAEVGIADLDRSKVPTGRIPMVPVGKIERLRRKRMLQSLDVVAVGDTPDLVQTSELVLRRNVRAADRLQERREFALSIVAPQPQAARVGASTANGRGAVGYPICDGLFVREHRRIISIEHAHDAASRGLILLARNLKSLMVDEERRLAIGYQRDVSEVSRRLHSGHVEEFGKVSGGDAGGAKRQQDRHAGEFRIAGSLR